MTCDHWFEALSARVDGELEGPESVELEAHLAGCSACRGLEGQLASMRRRALVHDATSRPDLAGAILGQAQVQRAANRVLVRRVAAVAAAAVVALCIAIPLSRQGQTGPAGQVAAIDTETVEVDQRTFSQREVDIAVGSTVRWENRSGTTHRLVHQFNGATVSGELAPGESESATFDEPGTYEFSCEIHDDMSGTVVVES